MLSLRKRVLVSLAVATAAAGAVTGGLTLAAGPASAASCADVEVVFARGTSELPGLGLAGGPFVNALKSDLAGKSVNSYAVQYAADILQTSAGPGATAMTNHVTSVAAQCPNTKFVLGGYSQGASVTDISIGIPTILGSGKTIPTNLAPRVAAVVVFGNPLALTGGHITKASKLYGGRAEEFCASGDPVCANGVNVLAHLTYGSNGMAAKGAKFAADQVRSAG